jgi:UDP-glucose 4-epimerase
MVLDSLCNSKAALMERITKITRKSPIMIEGDVRDAAFLQKLFSEGVSDGIAIL